MTYDVTRTAFQPLDGLATFTPPPILTLSTKQTTEVILATYLSAEEVLLVMQDLGAADVLK